MYFSRAPYLTLYVLLNREEENLYYFYFVSFTLFRFTKENKKKKKKFNWTHHDNF